MINKQENTLKKKVIIVGPSPYLKGMNLGSFIDDFDEVIKPNRVYALPQELDIDYGKRHDIIYVNKSVGNEDRKQLLKLKNTKVIYKIHKDSNSFKHMNIRKITRKYSFLNMVQLILHDLCFRRDINEIHIIGMDFYSRDGEKSYVEGYNTLNPLQMNNKNKTHVGVHDKAVNLKVLNNIINKGCDNHNNIDIILEKNCEKYFKNALKQFKR